jgi:hypothetical protein
VADDLEFKIVANDDASKVLDDVTKKAEKLEKLDPEIEISADGGKAEKEVKSLGELLEGLTDKQKEIVLKAQITSAEADLKRLERSLKDVRTMGEDELQIRLRAIDLATEDLEEARKLRDDLDAKDVEIKVDVSQSGTQSLQGLKGDLDGVRDSGDQSRSVLANMAGNTAQDLGEVGGIVGSLGVGLGQMAEYATEGNIKLSELAKVAGPMAGLAAAGLVVQTVMAGINTEKAFRAEQVEKFTEALNEGKSAIQVINDELRETGELAYVGGGGLLGLGKETKDLAAVARDAGLTYEQFLEVIQDSSAPDQFRDKVRLLREEQQKANSVSEANKLGEQAVLYGQLASGVQQYQELIGIASTKQEELNAWIGDATAKTADAARIYGEYGAGVRSVIEAEVAHAEAVEATAGALGDKLTGALTAAEEATTSFYSAQRAAADSGYAAQQATDDLTGSILTYDAALQAAGGDIAKVHDVQQEARDSATKYADSQVRLAEDTAAANGETLTAAQRQASWLQAMQDSTAFMGTDQKNVIAEYIAQVLGIPLSRVTEILANPDVLSLTNTISDLDDAAKDRDTTITVDADTTEAREKIAALREQAKLTLKVGLTVAGSGSYGGGYALPGSVGEVGELGRPELFRSGGQTWLVAPNGGQVIPLGSGGGSAGTTNVYTSGMTIRRVVRAYGAGTKRGISTRTAVR